MLVLFNPVLRFGPDMTKQRLNGDDALAKAISPTEHLEKNGPPTLLLDGTKDFLLSQGNEYIDKAKQLGVKTELYLAEGECHGFYNKPAWREKTTQRMAEFLEEVGYLK